MELNIHADDVEGCQYTIIEVGSKLMFITANGIDIPFPRKS